MSELQNLKSHIPKHVSRACLECRSRHLKCGGQEPICDRCRKHNRTCTYVKSHRGGSRKKGVSFKSKLNALTGNDGEVGLDIDNEYENEYENEEDDNNLETNYTDETELSNNSEHDKKSLSNSSENLTLVDGLKKSPKHRRSSSSSRNLKRDIKRPSVWNHKSDILPCVKNGMGHLADHPNCTEECLQGEKYNNIPECMKPSSSGSSGSNKTSSKINFHPVFNGSKDDDPINLIFDDTKLAPSLDACYISPSLTKDLNIESIVSSFYNCFYRSHPFLPPRQHILPYLEAIPFKTDLLLVMKIMGEGQTTSKYARDIETVNYLVISILKYVRQIGKDFITLQTLLLLAMISHISSLHDLSTTIREATISLAFEMKLNYIDEANVPPVFLDVNGFLSERDEKSINAHSLNTPTDSDTKTTLDSLFGAKRVASIPHGILVDTMRRTFWELYYFDSISGTASGHTKSRLATKHCLVLYPTSVSLNVFDYKSRAEACKLVNDAISLNIAIQSHEDSLPYLNHMRAALGNWEMKLSNPDTYAMPYLINKHGDVNDGVFEAIMLLNYARIFTHRPFSYLWRADVSKHPRCTDEEGVDDPCPPLNNKESQNATDSRKIIETKKTIDSANYLMKTLLDTDPGQTCKRTPFLACALAFSCLVHLSAYAWVESNLTMLDSLDENSKQISASELDTYTEYIKLEIGSTLQISRHWSLSAKLITHISETLSRVSPKLFKKVQTDILGLGFNIQTASSTALSKSESTTPSQTLKSETPDSNSFTSRQYNKTIVSDAARNIKSLPLAEGSSSNIEERAYSNALPNYMLLEGTQQQTPANNQYKSQSFNSDSQVQFSLPQPQPQPQPPQPQTAPFQNIPLNPPEQLSSSSHYNSNENSNNNNGSAGSLDHNANTNDVKSNTFMLEFNDLVSSMNNIQSNPVDDTGTVMGFPSEAQDYGFLDPLSPSSDTGCDWVDKHVFQFDSMPMANEG